MRPSLAFSDELLPAVRDVDVYFLGPKPFMRNCYQVLPTLGVPAANLRYEFFGPLEDMSA